MATILKKKKWRLRSGLTIKRFDSEIVFFGLDWEEITFYGQKNIFGKRVIVCAKELRKLRVNEMID